MPPPEPAPGPARRRRRPTLLRLMAVVVAAGLALAAVKYRMDAEARRARWEALKAEVVLANARREWADRMHLKGYVSAAKAEAARLEFERARAEADAFRGRWAR